jgi:hypothetical protein
VSLKDFAKNYQITTLSNHQVQWISYSSSFNSEASFDISVTNKSKSRLDAWFVTGFADAEGSFVVSIRKNPRSTRGEHYWVECRFSVGLHKKDLELLYLLQEYFGVGIVVIDAKKDRAEYRVSSLSQLTNVIIPLALRLINIFWLLKKELITSYLNPW